MKRITDYFRGNRRIKIVLLTLIALVTADGIISQFLVRYGLGWEGNPFLQNYIGSDAFLLVKLIAVCFCALILWDMSKSRPRLSLVTSLCFVVLYTGIIFWNLGVYFIA